MKVDLYLSGQLVDGLKPDTVVALTKQAAKWSNFTTRSADFSNVFELEPTAQLMQLLGHPDEVNSLSDKPYKRLPYELRVDGVPLSAGFAQLERVTDTVEIQLFSGFADFLQLIGDMKTTDIDISDQNHRWTVANVNNLRDREANTGGVVYPHINYRRFHSPFVPSSPSNSTVTVTDFYPAVYAARFVNEAAASVGWSVQGFDERWVWPFSKQDFKGVDVTLGKVERSTDFTPPIEPSGLYVIPFNLEDDFYNVWNTDSRGFYGYQCHYNGSYTFKFSLTLRCANNGANIRIYIGDQNFNSVAELDSFTNNSLFRTRNIEAELNFTSSTGNVSATHTTDLTLCVQVQAGGGLFELQAGSFWECVAHQGSTLANGWVDCNQIAPTLPIKDVLLQCAQRLCAAIVADPVNRVLNFIRLDDIARKAPVDLQPFLDELDKPEIAYELGDFGQENVFSYVLNEEEQFLQNNPYLNPTRRPSDPFPTTLSLIPDGVITVDDERLELSKEAVKPFFAKTYLLPVGNSTAPLPINTQVPCIFRYSTPRIPYLLPDIDPKQRSGRIDLETDPTQARFVPDEWQALITENYQTLIKMLNRSKVVKYNFWLPLSAFLNLDATRPVLVEGQKWYVRKINQFKVNQPDSVEIELIRL